MTSWSKKAAVLLLAAAMGLSLTACGKDDKKTGSGHTNQTILIGGDDTDQTAAGGKTTWYTAAAGEEGDDDENFTTTTTTKTTIGTVIAPEQDNSYKIVTKKYTSDDGKIKYQYPQITGLYDETMQGFYNKLFKNDLKAAVADIGAGTLTMKFDVKRKTKDQLSIVFYGGVFYDGAAHPFGYAYAYNIDLATGETFVPSEQISMDKAADAILADKWTLVGHADGVTKQHIVDYFSQFSEDSMKSTITESKVISVRRDDNGGYSVKGQNVCRSYLDSDGEPVLIVEVNHALGDYAEVKLA